MATLSREEATTKHPELEDVYALQPAASAFCKQQDGLTTDQENVFVSKVTDKAIESIAAGKEIPSFPQNTKGPSELNPTKDRDIDFD